MIIELKNFGPIEHFEFDTEKQMHFIFGENNIGKSYAISAVYLILKNFRNAIDSNDFKFLDYLPEHNQILEKIQISEGQIDISEEVENLIERFIRLTFLPTLKTAFSNSFSSISELSNQNTHKSFEIQIKTKLFIIKIHQNNNNLELNKISFSNAWVINKDEDYIGHYSFQAPFGQVFYISGEHDFNSKTGFYAGVVNAILKGKNSFSDIFFLPASRSGIYNGLSAFSAIIVQLTQLRNQIPNLKFEIPNLTEPVADYFLNISNINGKSYDTPYSAFAKQIEETIIKGKISFDKSNKKLYFEPNNLAMSLELSQVSSMISEIALITAHLKYIFNNEENNNGDNFLFIEEPEAHLHPKIQVELIKLFAELAKKGLKIVMTSHSNYMFNKLSNMILAKEISPGNINVAHMKMGEKGSFVDKNSMHVDEFGIEDDNFADTAEELYAERMKLYEQTH